MGKTHKRKRKIKGEKFKRFSLKGEDLAILLLMLRQSSHKDPHTELAMELIHTVEALGEGEQTNRGVGWTFPVKGGDVVVSSAVVEYLPTFFQGLEPSGSILEQYLRIKKTITTDKETVFDKELVEAGYERDGNIWFPPDSYFEAWEAEKQRIADGEQVEEEDEETEDEDDDSDEEEGAVEEEVPA